MFKVKEDTVSLLFYDNSLFSQSKTYNQWVPLACDDLNQLIPYRDIYQYTTTKFPDAYKVWFFANHPITHVSLRGWCLSANTKYYDKSSTWIAPKCVVTLTITDYSGNSADIEIVTYSKENELYYTKMAGHFVRVNGRIKALRSGKRVVQAIDITAAAMSLTEELLLIAEMQEVREKILMQPWVPKLPKRAEPVPTEKVEQTTGLQVPSSFVSFFRHDSRLYQPNASSIIQRTLLPSSKLKTSSRPDLSFIEQHANAQYSRVNGYRLNKSLQDEYDNTPHEERASDLINKVNAVKRADEDMHTEKTEVELSERSKLEKDLAESYHSFLLHLFTKENRFRLSVDDRLLSLTESLGLEPPDKILGLLVSQNIATKDDLRKGGPTSDERPKDDQDVAATYEWHGMDELYSDTKSVIDKFLGNYNQTKKSSKFLTFVHVKDKLRQTKKQEVLKASDEEILFAIRYILKQESTKWYETSMRGKYPSNRRWSPGA